MKYVGAGFLHRINNIFKKFILTLYLTILTFFTELWDIKSEMQVINSELWYKLLEKSQNWEINTIVRKKSELWLKEVTIRLPFLFFIPWWTPPPPPPPPKKKKKKLNINYYEKNLKFWVFLPFCFSDFYLFSEFISCNFEFISQNSEEKFAKPRIKLTFLSEF